MGFLSNIFGGIGNLIGGASKSLGSLFGGGGGAGGNLIQGISSLFGGGGSPQPPSPTPGSYSQMSKQSLMNSPYQPGSGFTMGNNSSSKPKGFLDSLFPGGVGQGLLGIGIPAIGDMFAPKTPNILDINSLQSVQAMQQFSPGKSVSPEYQGMLQNNVNRLRDKRVRDLQATYRSARPGTDYLTDTNYQRDLAEVERQVQGQLSDDLARAEGVFSSQEQERLSEIAQMDIYSIMAQTGLGAQEANDFKEMFSNMGNMLLTNATKKPGMDLMSLFGGA